MVDFQSLIIVGGLVLLIVAAMGALFFGWRDSIRRAAVPAHMQNDLTNMMILFQTMRDILAQQKDLAREFNISIDRKVGEVRKLIESTGDVRKELDRAKREIAVLSARTRKELADLERRLRQVDGKILDARGPALDSAEDAEVPDSPDSTPDEVVTPEEAAPASTQPVDIAGGLPPLDVGPSEMENPKDSFFERWAGVDFKTEEEAEEEVEAEESEVELTVVEVAQTRDAFRDLLNLHTETFTNGGGPSSSQVLNPVDRGGRYLTPIQRRVYEYSDAGMRVPEISRELGVGKGEIRLILSLRRDRER